MPTRKILILKKIIHVAGRINAITCVFGFFIIYGFAGTMDYMDKFGWENGTSDTEIMIKALITAVISMIAFLFTIATQKMEEIIDEELHERKTLIKKSKSKKSLTCDDTHLEKKQIQ